MIISELRDLFVTIVTESAFSVTNIVTESALISKGLHRRCLNNSNKIETMPVFRLPETCQDCVTSFSIEMGVFNL